MKIKGNQPSKYVVLTILCIFGLWPSPRAAAERFEYRYRLGDKYRIISTVREDVYFNYELSHRAEILNRAAVEVTRLNGEQARHKAVFQVSERATRINTAGVNSTDRVFQWAREFNSEFDRDRLGNISIERQYLMPVVRDVPIFPDRDLRPGDKWTAPGYELHDFSDGLGLAAPYRIQFTANYVFLGNRQWKGRPYPAFSISYRISSAPDAVQGRAWPVRITGAFDQTVYWDSTEGQPVAAEERFRLILLLSDGMTVEYRGTSETEQFISHEMNKNQLAGEIVADINRMSIPEASVRVVDEGIIISLENIQFEVDTAIMLPGEREKLDKIAGILARYPERDILVGGHTALAGNAEGRARLSTERAAVVAEYLLAKKVRTPDRVVVRGYGAEKPIADNRTEAGKRKNRRVEITILEN